MRINLTQDQTEALAVMVALGEEDRTRYLDTYAAENEESPEQIAAGHRQVEAAHDAMAAILNANAAVIEGAPVDEGATTSLLTISADFHVTGDPEGLRAPIERAVADVLEDSSHDGIFSIPGASAEFLTAEVTAVYAHPED